ncbi:hypothetical protein JW933_03385 [candidate division FCPU426 bacterium]|nr:hypothetical protein [candidate division FCPU426 bacterium]
MAVGLATVPVYSSWQQHDPGENCPVDQRYAALSELTKNDLRQHFPQGLVPRHCNVAEGLQRGEIEFVQSSGTTAERVTNIWHQSWWNASEASSWKLNSHTAQLDGTQREAILASALNVGILSDKDLTLQDRRLSRFLFLNEKAGASEWTDRHYERMLQELEAFQPVVLEANPSLLARLAWWALDKGAPVFQPRIIVFTYEFSSSIHLRCIRRVFSAPLVSSYGATEAGYVFMQCEHGSLHQNTDFCRVDFQPLKAEHGGPQLGRILLTTFHHPWVSLIKFDVGDLVRLHDSHSCPCGRNEGFLLSSLEGRLANATFTPEGRLVTTKQADDTLAAVDGIRDYQLVHLARNDYTLQLLVDANPDLVVPAAAAALRSLYGKNMRVRIEPAVDILPGVSGKYRRTHAVFHFDGKGLFS